MNEGEILVIGHRNPDTDAICSAIGYAEYKRLTGTANVFAARCGEINERIEFVLKTFGVDPPRFVADVSPKVRDVMQTQITHAAPETTLSNALAMMDEHNIRVLPILDKQGVCRGFASIFKMVRVLCPPTHWQEDSRRLIASVSNLARTLDARISTVSHPESEDDLILLIGAMNPDAFARKLANYPSGRLAVFVGDSPEIQALAIRGRARVLVVTGGEKIATGLEEEARKLGVSVLVSPHNTATTVMLCRAAVTVQHLLHEHFLSFREEDLLEDVQSQAMASPYQAFPVLNGEHKMVGILSKSDFLKKVKRQLILVDHNELSQAVPGADRLEILEIIDHHRLGVQSTSPILVHNEPVGSTSTIVADCFFRTQVKLPRSIAGLLLAGLVSDTLNLTSPTTTEKDRQILLRLEKLCETKASEFTEKLFASGSVLVSRTPEQAITTDCKEFQEHGHTFSAAQIEELGFDQFWKRKAEVVGALERYRRQHDYYFSALLITDVVRQTSLLLVTGASSVLKQVDYHCVEPGIFELPGVVSRKKQLLPYLSACLGKLGHRQQYEEPTTMV